MNEREISLLKEISALHDQGVLTDDEFEAEKRKILQGQEESSTQAATAQSAHHHHDTPTSAESEPLLEETTLVRSLFPGFLEVLSFFVFALNSFAWTAIALENSGDADVMDNIPWGALVTTAGSAVLFLYLIRRREKRRTITPSWREIIRVVRNRHLLALLAFGGSGIGVSLGLMPSASGRLLDSMLIAGLISVIILFLSAAILSAFWAMFRGRVSVAGAVLALSLGLLNFYSVKTSLSLGESVSSGYGYLELKLDSKSGSTGKRRGAVSAVAYSPPTVDRGSVGGTTNRAYAPGTSARAYGSSSNGVGTSIDLFDLASILLALAYAMMALAYLFAAKLLALPRSAGGGAYEVLSKIFGGAHLAFGGAVILVGLFSTLSVEPFENRALMALLGPWWGLPLGGLFIFCGVGMIQSRRYISVGAGARTLVHDSQQTPSVVSHSKEADPDLDQSSHKPIEAYTDDVSVRPIKRGLAVWGGTILIFASLLAIYFSQATSSNRSTTPVKINPHSSSAKLVTNQSVEVLWNGSWFPATVLAVHSDGKALIHYKDYGDNWDEVVTKDRIRVPQQATAAQESKAPERQVQLVIGLSPKDRTMAVVTVGRSNPVEYFPDELGIVRVPKIRVGENVIIKGIGRLDRAGDAINSNRAAKRRQACIPIERKFVLTEETKNQELRLECNRRKTYRKKRIRKSKRRRRHWHDSPEY